MVRFAQQFSEFPGPHRTRVQYVQEEQHMFHLMQHLEKGQFPVAQSVVLMIGSIDLARYSCIRDMMEIYIKIVSILKQLTRKLILVTIPPIPSIENCDYNHFVMQNVNTFIRSQANGDKVYVINLDVSLIDERYVMLSYFEKSGPKDYAITLNRKGLHLLKYKIDRL